MSPRTIPTEYRGPKGVETTPQTMETVIASPALVPLIERFEAAFARLGIPMDEVRVTWNYDEGSCLVRCRMGDGTGWERRSIGRPGADPTTSTLKRVRETVEWLERAAARAALGGPVADHSCVVLPYPPEFTRPAPGAL